MAGDSSNGGPRARGKQRRWIVALGVLAVVTLAITAANVWMVVHRREGYLFRYVSHATAYSPSESLRVVGFTREHDGLVLETEPALAGPWEIRTSGARYESRGPHPRVHLTPGVHEVELEQRAGAELPRAIELTLVVDDPPAGRAGVGEISVLSMSVPFGRSERHPLAVLAAHPQHYPAGDVSAGRRILTALDLPEGDTVGTIERLMKYVHDALDSHRGAPSHEMLHRLMPLAQLRRAQRGADSVHCANFAAVYTYFAALAGIPTREVTVTGEHDGVLLGGHTFAESFLVEQGRWAYVDPTFGLGLVQAPNGTYLDAVRLSRLHEVGAIGELHASVLIDGELRRVPYPPHARFSRIYLNRDATYLFHRPERHRHETWMRIYRLVMGTDLSYAADPVRERHPSLLFAQGGLTLLWLAILARAISRAVRRRGAPDPGPRASASMAEPAPL